MSGPMLLAIDQGSSGTKAVLVDAFGVILARGLAAVGELHPHHGWVEQDPWAIWQSVQRATAVCMADQDARAVVAVGLSTQRESIVVWDRLNGQPLTPVLSWQDQRSAALCDELRSPGNEALVRERSGLPLDPMFSAAKAAWLAQNSDPVRTALRAGRAVIGTIDTWLLSRFGGEPVTEIGNASRTQLLHTRDGVWDEALLDLFGVPRQALPEIVPSTGPFPGTRGLAPLLDGTPVLAVMGDSHAALFAHGAFSPGRIKATYGTGSSIMGLIARPETLDRGACLTIGWQMGGDVAGPAFAAEGNIRATGAALRWMAGILDTSVDKMLELGARSQSKGVVLVPGFTGLGAPWWDRNAVGLISNLGLETGRAELARAAMEAVVHQVTDVIEVIGDAVGTVHEIFADGGPSGNRHLMQLQADTANCVLHRSEAAELSALGVAHMAGLTAGLWDWAGLRRLDRPRETLLPVADPEERIAARGHWRVAVDRARSGQIDLETMRQTARREA